MAGRGAKLATGWLELTVSTQGAQGQIVSEMTGAGQRSGRGFSLGFAALLGGVAGAVATVASKAVSALTGLVSEAVTASDATDKFKQTLRFAGLDTSVIDSLTKSARQYADQTVYSLSDIQGITAQLAANGVPNFDQLAQAAGNLNAVAGGNADTFRSVGMVLTQTAGAGKLTTENWNQLSDAIPGASGMLQEALLKAGAYTGNFRDAMAKGQISATEFNAALMKLGMTDVAREAATSTATIEGAVGNLQASIVGLFSDLVSVAKPAITSVLGVFANGISAATPFFTGLASAIAGVFTILTTGDFKGQLFAAFHLEEDSATIGVIFGIRDALVATGNAIGSIWGSLSAAFQPLMPVLAQLAPQVLDLWTSFSPLSVILQALTPVLPQITQMLSQVGTAVGGALTSALSSLLPPLLDIVTALQGALLQAFQAVLPVVGQLIPVVVQIAGTLGGVLATAIGAVAPVLVTVAQLIAQLVPVIMPVITAVLGLISPILGLITPLLRLIGPILNPLIQLLAAVLTPILGLVAPLVQLLAPALQFVAQVLGVVVGAVATALDWFVRLVTGNKEAGDQFMGVWNAITGFFSGIGQFFADVWNGLIQGITQFIVNAVTFFRQIPDQIMSVFSGVGSWLFNVGRDLINGLLNGAGSLLRGIGDFFLSVLPGWIVDPFKAALGIHSPSRVFAQLGEYTMQGYIDGIGSMQGRVSSATTSAVALPTRAATARIPAGSSGAGIGSVVVVDADRKLIGRMQVEADGRVAAAAHSDDVRWSAGEKSL